MPLDAIPAATLILLRDRTDAPPDVLMVERAATMAFAGGATVFPGGRVDAGDGGLAEALNLGADGAARVAAIRETLEETGLAVAMRGTAAGAMRAGLAAGRPFAAVLTGHDGVLEPEALVPFARWRPDQAGMRNFDTRFFLAAAPEGAGEPVADGGESVAAAWRPARDWLAAADNGAVRLIFPTRRVLERLARFGSCAEAVADAGAHPPVTVTPWVETRGGVAHLCLPEGIGYPVTAVPLDDARRG